MTTIPSLFLTPAQSRDRSGVITPTLVGAANAGVVQEHLSSMETRLLESGGTYFSDLQITDAAGEVLTFTWTDGLEVTDSYTNRTS